VAGLLYVDVLFCVSVFMVLPGVPEYEGLLCVGVVVPGLVYTGLSCTEGVEVLSVTLRCVDTLSAGLL